MSNGSPPPVPQPPQPRWGTPVPPHAQPPSQPQVPAAYAPGSASAATDPAASTRPPRRGLRGGAVAAIAGATAVVAAGAGLLVGWAIFSTSAPAGGGSDAERAAYNVDVACTILERLDPPFSFEDISIDDPLIWELSAIGQLFTSAAAYDDDFAEWDEMGKKMLQGSMRFDEGDMNDSARDLLDDCEAR